MGVGIDTTQKAPQQPITVVVDSGSSWADFAGDVLDAALEGRFSALVVLVLVLVVLIQARAIWKRRR